MSPDRLAELRRQRALVAQHLAWIDAELTAAGAGQSPSSPQAALDGHPDASFPGVSSSHGSTAPAATPAPLSEEPDPALALANTRADEIIEKYRATEALDPAATKRGCLVLFGAIFALAGAILLAIYYFLYSQN